MYHMCIPLFWPSTMPYFSALSTFNNFSSLTLVAFFQGTHKMNYYTGPFLLLPGCSTVCERGKKADFPTAKFYIVKATLMRAAWSSEWMSVEILPQQSKKVTHLVLCAIDVSSLKKAQFTQYNNKDPPACKLLLSHDLAYVFSMKDNNSYYRFSLPKVLPLYTAFLCVPQETLVHLVVPSSSVMEQKIVRAI